MGGAFIVIVGNPEGKDSNWKSLPLVLKRCAMMVLTGFSWLRMECNVGLL
jgi:hypothetical protein